MIAVDWGTSNLRAFRLAEDGTVLDRHGAACGILAVPPGDFPATLARAIAPWLRDGERHVLLCGMVGSRQGWIEAPYLPCPAGPAEIAAALVPVAFDGASVLLVPGLSARDAAGTPEVMRGEETQLVGVMDRTGGEALVCLPGSHSKWAWLRGGAVAGFATYLNGEAFAALRDGTILGRMMRREDSVDPAGFDRGVARSGDQGHLLHHLFGVRALGLFGELPDGASAGYLSGLLIGHEVRAAMPEGGRVHLVGAAGLCALYARAIAAIGGHAVVLDADAAAHGMALIGRQARWS